ncbi:head-tail connector protein [Novosphingobium mangrovi (ex Huang et al. 2023)]|uniref:PhiE125 gp8 family phage protein n=1 Tax=Novosphingobium mangrovi (ex Huang et al. 2023) TaxID=2976432 RepID=A0ABT2I327_9SPHN|nr:hypothetical protein [Novosphingobium mangrovi (ex Huang et al. 2023)]MCT2399205.1 hypothetical protein [Novosphingobium mangrovi (ex Huang et al. 2023)]
MNRVILTPPVLPGTALAELKQWLGITTTADDAPLLSLLAATLDVCEGFTGQMPLEAECEEVLPATAGWHTLGTRPVQAISTAETIAPDGTRTALDAVAYAIDLQADGTGRIRLPGGNARVAVRFTAGLAANWDALPQALRHGLIRLAAHQHRERESAGAAPLPPASVAALWRPWRRVHLT